MSRIVFTGIVLELVLLSGSLQEGKLEVCIIIIDLPSVVSFMIELYMPLRSVSLI